MRSNSRSRSPLGYRSSIADGISETNHELRRSRGNSGFPMSRRADLAGNLEFVVVFQTIQIERLNSEVESLRVALREYENQLFNVQNFEVQIKELTDQCYNYDQELEEYKAEVDKLSLISQSLYEELQNWKTRYHDMDPQLPARFQDQQRRLDQALQDTQRWQDRFRALQRSKDQELEQLRSSMESQRRSTLNRQLQEMMVNHQNIHRELESQIRKLQDTCQHHDQEKRNLEQQLGGMRIIVEEKNEIEWRLRDLEGQLDRMNHENLRLNDLLRRRQEDLDNKDRILAQIRQEINQIQHEYSTSRSEMAKIPHLQAETRDLKTTCAQLERKAQESAQEARKVPELSDRLSEAKIEIDRLTFAVRGKLEQLATKEKQLERVYSQCEQLKRQEQRIPELETKIRRAEQQNSRIEGLIRKRVEELEEQGRKNRELESVLRNWEAAEPRKKHIEAEHQQQQQHIRELSNRILELERINSVIPEMEERINIEATQKEECMNEIGRLNMALQQLSNHIDALQNKCENLTQQIESLKNLQAELQNYQIQNKRLTQEFDRLQGKIKERTAQLNKITEAVNQIEKALRSYAQIEQKLKASISSTEKLVRQLDQSRSQNQELHSLLLDLENKLSQAEYSLMDMNEQNENLKRKVAACEDELAHKKREAQKMHQQIAQLKEFKTKHEKALRQIQVLEKRLEEESKRLRTEQNKTQELTHNVETLNLKIQKIHRQGYFPNQFKQIFSRIKESYIDQHRDLRAIKEHQKHLERAIAAIQQELGSLEAQQRNSTSKFVNQVVPKVNQAIEKMQHISSLQEQVNRLELDNFNLESKVKIMALEMSELELVSKASALPPASTPSSHKSISTAHVSRIARSVEPNPDFSSSYREYSSKKLPSVKNFQPPRSSLPQASLTIFNGQSGSIRVTGESNGTVGERGVAGTGIPTYKPYKPYKPSTSNMGSTNNLQGGYTYRL